MRVLPALAFLIGLLPASGAELLVGAASDLGTLSDKLGMPASKPLGMRVRFTLASSGDLAQQIANGAPFDVFLSANESYVTDSVKKGYLDGSTVQVYARGKLALWSKSGSVRSLDDLRKPGVLHVAIPDPQHAPYGIAARAALEKSGLWKSIESKIVYGENVRQALQFAETGNADAVITSWTLLQHRGVLLSEDLYPPIRQAGAVLKSSAQPGAARMFLKFLSSPEGQKILAEGGLFPP
ncbi:MAG: molybdate ABC transporter substrate-binding protein [Bryobacterales bacterium]|nr:molybdate ABC transporter substrate-binding protein [Bryobacterales bacterium]MBV9398987.1 molybdate ABC transporter substrate-binding protein [Bryobacterales bacterium]